MLQELDYELKHLKDNRMLYLQQPNSNIYFKCSKADALNHLTKEKETLQDEQSSS
ncbi:hypothetical protein SK128_005849 [Halocaridina rubra]|uniref:Uncharacterized protein n=1 Tax=Halocaridina rubra TaxID=373956 RepID=A0AAN8WE29_HALRR